MFASAEGNPKLINVNVLHLGNCKNQSICITGSDHDLLISTLRSNVHVQHDACISFFMVQSSMLSLLGELKTCSLYVVHSCLPST